MTKTRLIWTEKTIFFDIFKDRVENKLSQKFYHILAIEKQAVSFVEVACHLFMNRPTFDFFQLLGKDLLCKQFLKIIDRGLTIEDKKIEIMNIQYTPFSTLSFSALHFVHFLTSFSLQFLQ